MGWGGITHETDDPILDWIVPTVALMLLGTTTVVVWMQVESAVFALIDILPPLLSVSAIIWVSLTIQTRDVPASRVQILVRWFGLGLAIMFLLALWPVVLQSLGQQPVPVGVQFMTQVVAGGLFGLLVGVYSVRARQSTERATEAKVEQEFLERQQETNEVLNRILRHHLLNALTSIRGRTEIAQEHSSDAGQRHLRTVIDRIDGMSETIADIRDVTRTLTVSPELTPISVTQCVEREVQAARSRYPDAEFGYDREVEPAPVMADDLLSRAVSNLLANAVEHNDSDVPSVEVRVDVDGPAVRISVADNGPGIPDAEIDSVFDPSERGLESDGEGLGLFLVASIVRQYDGRVDVADTATGTCFTITLPRATVDAEVRVEAAEKDGFLPTPRLLPADGRAALD